MNEPCRLCGSGPTLATYYDFYRFHCPTPGCKEHMGDWKVYSGKGKWYGSIDEARDAWNKRQERGETPSAPETAEPEQMPAEADDEPQDGVKHKTKKQLRAEAVERLRKVGMEYDVPWYIALFGFEEGDPEWGSISDAEMQRRLIDLLTDDDYGTMEAETSQVPEHDTREQLEADIRRAYWCLSEQEIEPVFGWLNRQAAITHREVLCQPDERDEQIAELTAERDEAYKRGYDDGLHANTRAAFSAAWQTLGDESANRLEGGIIKSQAQRIRELEAERDKLLAKLEAYSDFEKAEFAIPLDEAMKFTADPPGYVKKHIAELQAENKLLRGEWESERDYADQCEARAKALAAKCDCLNDVVRKQADSFAKMERELHDAKVEAKHNRDGVERLTEKCQAQREELAKLNAEKRGTRKLPKKVVWPRDEKGKPVTLNALGAKNILFDSRGYLIEYRDGTTRYETYKQAKEAADGAEG